MGIEIHKENIDKALTAKIVSCSQEAAFLCMREFAPKKVTKFPCIPPKHLIRTKRKADDKRFSTENYNGNGKR